MKKPLNYLLITLITMLTLTGNSYGWGKTHKTWQNVQGWEHQNLKFHWLLYGQNKEGRNYISNIYLFSNDNFHTAAGAGTYNVVYDQNWNQIPFDGTAEFQIGRDSDSYLWATGKQHTGNQPSYAGYWFYRNKSWEQRRIYSHVWSRVQWFDNKKNKVADYSEHVKVK